MIHVLPIHFVQIIGEGAHIFEHEREHMIVLLELNRASWHAI